MFFERKELKREIRLETLIIYYDLGAQILVEIKEGSRSFSLFSSSLEKAINLIQNLLPDKPFILKCDVCGFLDEIQHFFSIRVDEAENNWNICEKCAEKFYLETGIALAHIGENVVIPEKFWKDFLQENLNK